MVERGPAFSRFIYGGCCQAQSGASSIVMREGLHPFACGGAGSDDSLGEGPQGTLWQCASLFQGPGTGQPARPTDSLQRSGAISNPRPSTIIVHSSTGDICAASTTEATRSFKRGRGPAPYGNRACYRGRHTHLFLDGITLCPTRCVPGGHAWKSNPGRSVESSRWQLVG